MDFSVILSHFRNYCGKKGIEFLIEGFKQYLTGLEEICLNLAKFYGFFV